MRRLSDMPTWHLGDVMKFGRAFWVFACLCSSVPAWSTPTTPIPMTSIDIDRHADLHAQKLREARIIQKYDLLFTPSSQRSCKYASDISIPPPAMRVALTFDDGPDATGTPYLLDVLRKYQVRATFFVVGQAVEANPELLRRVVDEGHLLVGSHSWSHPNFHALSVAEQAEEVARNEELLGEFLTPRLFRYPYGNSTCETNDLLRARGYKIVGWHVDSCDWAFNKTGTVTDRDARICEVLPRNKSDFVSHVVDSIKARKGGVLLMHEIQPNTLHQLEVILDRLVREGFTFGNLDEEGFQRNLW